MGGEITSVTVVSLTSAIVFSGVRVTFIPVFWSSEWGEADFIKAMAVC